MTRFSSVLAAACGTVLLLSGIASAQFPPQPVEYVSPEVSPERKITFRVHAPEAKSVRLSAGDIPVEGAGRAEMTEGENGVWEVAVGPVPPGAYRYTFSVDGLAVVDPRNPATSESNANSSSLVVVPGSEFADLADVPHGAVAEVRYHSKSLDRPRRMHVYTPHVYEKGDGQYPVFYLLHGASDSDNSWTTVGRAGVILDNLIAAGKAKPMIVVMPAGHTGPFRFGGPGGGFNRQMDEFAEDFTSSVRPYIEANYRVLPGRENRALAGLSMGGAQTLNIGFANLAEYGYLGVFSSGVFGIAGGGPGGGAPNNAWEESHAAALDDAELKQGLKLVWFACGKDDFLLSTNNATVAMLKKHGFEVTSQETDGGHTWIKWRDYLNEFAPLLFRE
jgi:enterochelin esterase-like enzyme